MSRPLRALPAINHISYAFDWSLAIPRPPSEEELLETEEGPRQLAGFLVGRQADRVATDTAQGRTVLDMHFRH